VKFKKKPACTIIPCAESMHHPIHLLVDPSIPTPLTKKKTVTKGANNLIQFNSPAPRINTSINIGHARTLAVQYELRAILGLYK
jgi:hypothetical protein